MSNQKSVVEQVRDLLPNKANQSYDVGYETAILDVLELLDQPPVQTEVGDGDSLTVTYKLSKYPVVIGSTYFNPSVYKSLIEGKTLYGKLIEKCEYQHEADACNNIEPKCLNIALQSASHDTLEHQAKMVGDSQGVEENRSAIEIFKEYGMANAIQAMEAYAHQERLKAVRETLRMASELSQEMIYDKGDCNMNPQGGLVLRKFQVCYAVPKQSILSLEPQVIENLKQK